MRTGPALLLALVALTSVAGCAAAPEEPTDASDGALDLGLRRGAIAEGLYASEDATGYLRVAKASLFSSAQHVTWKVGADDFGAGESNANNGTITVSGEGRAKLSIQLADGGLDVTVTPNAGGRGYTRHYHAVSYDTFNGPLVPKDFSLPVDARLALRNTSADGADLVVVLGEERSTQHLTWDSFDTDLRSDACGGIKYSRAAALLKVDPPIHEAGCDGLNALYKADTVGIGFDQGQIALKR